ncbi:coiled-coil domain containing 61 [Turdus rufiventris]|nr:coiled-coil domain containing 61 [Turdus rufiventris]
MAEPRYLQAECAFRPGTHTVRVTLTRSTLRVEVEAHGTADLWRGEFDATFIEDLTRKTGNFKQFGIFCSMLESALTQSSDSVSLELLTYTDLETLHSRKVGVTRPPPSTRSPLNTKRYLILVYSVEFDRIHYPLPLPYAGRPDLVALVRELQEQLAQLRAQRLEETQHLRDALWQAVEEKRAAEARHQREYQQMAAELTQAKAAEKRLQLRVKNLTAELASYKRGDRRVTRTRRPLSISSCNGPCMGSRPAASHKLPGCRTGGKRPGKENHIKESSAELAEIDARLQALQEYMDSLNTRM